MNSSQVGDPSLGDVVTLPEFLATADRLSLDERRRVVDQALVLIEGLYVHLPLKRAMHAVDPLQRLRLVRSHIEGMSERRFHDEMISTFVELRDLHTNYILPAPFQGHTAFLPFRLEQFSADGRRRYIVAATAGGLGDEHFKAGVEVTHWNGVPIDRAVELNADRQAGSNPDARHARGLSTMTIRPMGLSAPPDEDWVVLGFASEGEAREIRLGWQVLEPDPSPTGVDPNALDDPAARSLGQDALIEAVRRTSKTLFKPEAMEVERRMGMANAASEGAPGPDFASVSRLPDVLQFRVVATPQGEFGYIRIRTFSVRVEAFIEEVVRILGLLPKSGLILDVRGNGGGVIMAGERLLQLFTPRRIEPKRLHFINTPLALSLCTQVPDFSQWRESIAQSVETGAAFSDGFPVLPGHAEDCNRIGQLYHGPVVMITDALCYSTTDIFAAGFQDHAIGPILGTSRNTGAGGANVWTHDLIRDFLGEGSAVGELPGGTSFRVAVRRTTRVGERSGDPVEDLGVVPNAVHEMTRRDLLEGNVDLIARAGEMLAALPLREVELRAGTGDEQTLALTTRNLTRLDVYADGRPRASLDTDDGQTTVEVPEAWGAVRLIEILGFDGDELVAARRIGP